MTTLGLGPNKNRSVLPRRRRRSGVKRHLRRSRTIIETRRAEFVAEPPRPKPIETLPTESLNGGSSDTYDWERTTAEPNRPPLQKGVSLAFDDSDLLELPTVPCRADI